MQTDRLTALGFARAPANDPDYSRRPVAQAVDEMAAELLSASAGQQAVAVSEPKLTSAERVELMFDLAQAPADRPNAEVLHKGFVIGLQALCMSMGEIKGLSLALQELRRAEVLSAASQAQTQRPLARRKLRYPAYDLMLKLGEEPLSANSLLPQMTVGSVLLSWLNGVGVDRRFLKRIKQEYSRQTSRGAGTAPIAGRWTRSAQEAALRRLVLDLRIACRAHPAQGRRIGLVSDPSTLEPQHAVDWIRTASRVITDRWAASADYMRPRARQAAGGYGTLSEEILLETGCLIRAGADTRPQRCVLVCYEILFNITVEMAPTVVVIDEDDQHPQAALAVHVSAGRVRASLEWLLDGGRKPLVECLWAFEPTKRWVWITLPPWWADAQKELAAGLHKPATSLNDLLGGATHHPKSDLLGRTTGYQVTVNRARDSLPAALLADRIPRAVAAVALSQYGLVSQGRMFYGMVSGRQIGRTLVRLYRRLGWLRGKEQLPECEQLCGSAVVPTIPAVQAVMQTLGSQVELACEDYEAQPSLDTWLRRHDAILAFVACVAELCLCLRRAETYVLAPRELSSKHQRPHINDKAVHPLGGGPASGKAGLLVKVIEGWIAYLTTAASDQVLQESDAGRRIAAACLAAAGPDSEGLLVAFDVHGHVLGAGSATWMGKLPSHLQIGENFARHFWPYHLHEMGLVQWHLDYLLRHRLNAWEHETSDDPVPGERVRADLIQAMDSVITQLTISLPQILQPMQRRSS
jgi:hypothetical protein